MKDTEHAKPNFVDDLRGKLDMLAWNLVEIRTALAGITTTGVRMFADVDKIISDKVEMILRCESILSEIEYKLDHVIVAEIVEPKPPWFVSIFAWFRKAFGV